MNNNQDISYGFIQATADGTLIHANKLAKELIFSNPLEGNSLFQLVKNNEVKKNLHECFMGKSKEFIVSLNKQPHLFLFHFSPKQQNDETVHIYIFNIYQLQNAYDNNNWNQHFIGSIGEMAAGIAHEVRNPLTSVKGFLQLMEESFHHEYISIAQGELDRAIRILNDLMSVSKPEFAQEEQTCFNVCAEIESTLLLFQNHFYKIKLVKKFENSNGMIVARKDQLKKAFFNLIKNSIEAMPDGGTLTIEEKEDFYNIHIIISDTGVGIPKDKLRLLGTPFFTMKQDGKGMGLAQVFNAVQSNHGKIRVTSEENKGTTFYLTFPKTWQHNEQFTGGFPMLSSTKMRQDMSDFLKKNEKSYNEQWINYIEKNKNYISSFLEDKGEWNYYKKSGSPIYSVVADNIAELKTEHIMDIAKDRGINGAKMEFPIHLIWELFQSSRGFVWNAIKAYFTESEKTLSMEDFFVLERDVNDIIDLYIDSFTAYYVNYKEELLQSHRETVDELSVPIIPVAERICILPIVGYVDTFRAKKIREKTLVRVKELKAEQLIIDISGVPFVDTAVVNHLFKIVKGIKLLGCSTTLTGINPEIADTMIELGIDMGDEIKTKSDLQQALQELQIVPSPNYNSR